MIELYEELSRKDANLRILVLSSVGIPYSAIREKNGWRVSVPEKVLGKAIDAQARYDAENPEAAPPVPPPDSPPLLTPVGVWASLVIMVCHIAVLRYGGVDYFAKQYGASASHILEGELFRTVTALLLHSDVVHLAGNMAGCALFFSAVCVFAGFGAGVLSILTAGALGNYIVAVAHKGAHLSIGASTAVFAAVGILTGHQVFLQKGRSGHWKRAWLPLGSGICLLGFLSAGENTDLLAHLFGFCVGIAIGALYHLLAGKPARPLIQYLSLALTAGIMVAAWLRLY